MLYERLVRFAKSIDDFGLRHLERINLISKSQDIFIKHQAKLFNGNEFCLNCGRQLNNRGVYYSELHDVLTDHRVGIKRLTCTCGWHNNQ
jgi:hypothetical protein